MIPETRWLFFVLGLILASLEPSLAQRRSIVARPINIPDGTVFKSWWSSSPDFEIAELSEDVGLPNLPSSTGVWYLKSNQSSEHDINFHLSFDLLDPRIGTGKVVNALAQIEYSSYLAPATLWPVLVEDHFNLGDHNSEADIKWITIVKTMDFSKSDKIEITGVIKPTGYFVFNKILLELIIDESITQPPPTTTTEATTTTFIPNQCTDIGTDPCVCVQNPACTFCTEDGFSHRLCDLPENLMANGCPVKKMCGAVPTQVIDVSPHDDFVTDSPSNVPELTVCPCNPTLINVTFHLAAHPVDVYLLMDFSGSMSDDKANVVKLSGELIKAIKDISPDHQLGFGTFVDKPIYPFGSYSDYSFHNNLPLTKDISDFNNTVAAVPIKSGSDGPESQIDGMFQAAVCTEQIGWRQNTRRIMIVATDASYHKAPEGTKYGLDAFNQKCSLDTMGYYTEEATMDYPSDSQIVKAINDNNITTIFAVTSDAANFYKHFLTQMTPSAMGNLTKDSSNVVDIIVEEYKKIASRVELVHDSTGDELTVTFYSNCNDGSDHETAICEGLALTGSVTFTMELDLTKCPSDASGLKKTIRVHPKGLPIYAEVALDLYCKHV